jgi:GH18 family chitinase
MVMKHYTQLFSCVLFWFGVTGISPAAAQAQEASRIESSHAQQKRMVGYLPEWKIYSGFYPKNLVTSGSAEKLTHILYAFAKFRLRKGLASSAIPGPTTKRPWLPRTALTAWPTEAGAQCGATSTSC